MILHSQLFGEGRPLVILHGLLGMGDNWKTLGRQFADQGFQVHLVDQRNHGRSFHDSEFNYSVMAEDVKRYCDEHNLKNISLIGHSMGGKTAMRLATSHSEYVSKLIVADISPKQYPQHHQDILKALSTLDFGVLKSRGEAEKQLSIFLHDFGLRQFLLKNLYWREKGVLGLRVNLPVISKEIENVGEALPKEARFEGSTLFLGGAKSNYIEPQDELLIHHHFPMAEIDTIPDAGHWLHAENPTVFFDRVLQFLNAD